MSISRRGFLRSSIAATAAVPFLEHLSLDFCDAAPDIVDYFMGYAPNAIRLNRNENPFGPSPMAVEAIKQGLGEANRYVQAGQLRKALAEKHGVDEDMVLLGCGSTELLNSVPLAYLREGGNIVSSFQTYRTTPYMAQKLGAEVRWVKLKPDWTYDIKGLFGKVDSQTKIFYLVNPNNPTGTHLSYEKLASIAEALPKDVLFFIDEAYVQFLPGDGRNGIDLLKAGHDNVFVTRTFSKVYGLAGLRVGYGVGHPTVVKKVSAFILTFMNFAGYAGAIASLDDHGHVNKFLEQARQSKIFYEKELSALGINYIVGASPLIMVEVKEDSKKFVEKMAKENVFVRKGEDWDMPTYVRVSYGLDEQNRAVVAALKKLLT
jgi:histidinol-phosphate aminotransferase